MTISHVLTHRVEIGRLPTEEVVIVADENQLAALAEAYELQAVRSFKAKVLVTPGSRGSLEVEGSVSADVVQTCVVSLQPVEERVEETFSLRFVRASDAPVEPKPGSEVLIDPDAEDPPEVMDGPGVDIGAVVEEAFVLGINPYPRADGAALPVDVTDTGDEDEKSPFAALKKLKTSPSDKG